MKEVVFVLTIVAGPYETEADCERAKVLTIPGPMVRYECTAWGAPSNPAPGDSPIPPEKPQKEDAE